MKVNLSRFGKIAAEGEQTVLAGNPDTENTFENTSAIAPTSSKVKISKSFDYSAPGMSLTVIRIRTKK
jgi:alpha-N-arabinofuranosidase